MNVSDFGGDHSVQSIAQLEQLFGMRFKGDQNQFALSPDSSDYPLLLIYMRGNLAVIYYIPADREAGHVSLGRKMKMNLDPKKVTPFSIDNLDPGETIDVPNESVVPFSEALEVAKEFFDSQELPRSIKWRQL
jgi:hypothetical protein